MLPGCYDIEARIKDMDLDGVHAQLCFPNVPGFAGSDVPRRDRQGARGRVRVGVERLHPRRVVRGAPGPADPDGDGAVLGRRADGRRDPARSRPRARRRSRSPRSPHGSGCRRSTPITGTRCSPPRRRPTCRCACTSAAAAPRTVAPDAPIHRGDRAVRPQLAVRDRGAAALAGLPQVPAPQGRAVRGRHRLDARTCSSASTTRGSGTAGTRA